jgi:hypothetical protein
VVTADNQGGQQVVVITVYEPDPSHWKPDCRTRTL